MPPGEGPEREELGELLPLLFRARVLLEVRLLRVVERVPLDAHRLDVEDDARHGQMLFSSRPPMKTVARVLLALAALWPVACARREAAPAPSRDTVYRHLDGDPADARPDRDERGDRPARRGDALPAPRRDRPGAPLRAGLATSWTVSPDGLTYEFRLDPAARWQDGTAGHVGGRRVHDRPDPRPEGRRPPTGRRASRTSPSVETPEPVAGRRPVPASLRASGCSPSTCPIVSRAAFGREPSPDRKPVRERTLPARALGNGPEADARPARGPIGGDSIPSAGSCSGSFPTTSCAYRAGVRGELDEFKVSRDQRAEAERSAEFRGRNRMSGCRGFSWSWRRLELPQSDPRRRARAARARAVLAAGGDGAAPLSARRDAARSRGPYPAGVPENAPDVAPPPYDPARERAPARRGGAGRRARTATGAARGRRVSLEMISAGGPADERQHRRDPARGLRKGRDRADAAAARLGRLFAAVRGGGVRRRPDGQRVHPAQPRSLPLLRTRARSRPAGANAGFYRNPEADSAMEALRLELDAVAAARAVPAGAPPAGGRSAGRLPLERRTSTGASRSASKTSRSRRWDSSTSCPARSAGGPPGPAAR